MIPAIQSLIRSPYYDGYLEHVTSPDIEAELHRSGKALTSCIEQLDAQQLEHRYAPGKWSIRQIVHHLIDTELIFNYRALKIGRDTTSQVIDGFDENVFSDQVKTGELTRTELIQLFNSTRQTSLLLYKTFSEAQLNRIGIASGQRVQVKALFFIHAGHTLHHTQVIHERYLS